MHVHMKHAHAHAHAHAQVLRLSEQLNLAQRALIPPHETQSWFKLFRHVDYDRSGLISYTEFVEMVRKLLKISAQKLPDVRLRAVWRALDTSGDGLLQAGEVRMHMHMHMHMHMQMVSSRPARYARVPVHVHVHAHAHGLLQAGEVRTSRAHVAVNGTRGP